MERVENAEYFHAKQSCYLCLNNHDVVDTSIIVEGEGVLAICRSCIADLARTAGFDLDDRSKEIQELRSTIDKLEGQRIADERFITSVREATTAKRTTAAKV